jgi:ParB/RepB/Spo0J family partition protein
VPEVLAHHLRLREGRVTRIARIPTRDLTADPANVRSSLGDLTELAASIKRLGQLQPLVVRESPTGLVVIDGHRRLAAAVSAGVPEVLCIVTGPTSESQATLIMLAAAMHRQLEPMDQARAFRRLREAGMSVAAISARTGYSGMTVRARLALLDLPDDAQRMVRDKKMTLREAGRLTKSRYACLKSDRSAWFTRSHRLALGLDCDHGDARTILGGVACGQCWEAAIRADERGELECAPPYDEVLVQRVLNGERLSMSRTDRLEAVRILARRGWSDARIAGQVRVSERQVIRDRQALDEPSRWKPGVA